MQTVVVMLVKLIFLVSVSTYSNELAKIRLSPVGCNKSIHAYEIVYNHELVLIDNVFK